MPRNVEVKAKVDDIDRLFKTASNLSDTVEAVIHQHDTFFKTDKGRLKLRKFNEHEGELIYYERPDSEGPKTSEYSKSLVTNPDELTAVLRHALGIRGTVQKVRQLYMVGQTRIHVDQVEGLGDFMELEVVLRDDQSAKEGDAIARELLEKLGVPRENLLSGAYMDLLETQ